MRRAARLFGRALRLRCPDCGRARVVRGWLAVGEVCPACGLRLEREDGFFTGAIAANMVLTEGLLVLGLGAWLIRAWPAPPWDAIQAAGVAAAVGAPLLLWPFSKTLWLATTLLLHPAEPREFVAPERAVAMGVEPCACAGQADNRPADSRRAA